MPKLDQRNVICSSHYVVGQHMEGTAVNALRFLCLRYKLTQLPFFICLPSGLYLPFLFIQFLLSCNRWPLGSCNTCTSNSQPTEPSRLTIKMMRSLLARCYDYYCSWFRRHRDKHMCKITWIQFA
jgi:hypothetical protein